MELIGARFMPVSWRKAMKVLCVVGLGALALWGCTADYVKDSQAPVLFKIVDINGGSPLTSDPLVEGTVTADLAPVTVAVRSKNPNFSNVPQVAMAVFLDRYEVRYIRSDGRNVEGVDVPYHFAGNLTTVEDVKTSGGATISLEVVRLQAKLEPPLLNLVGSGGAIVFTCFAEITIYGHTTAGQTVKDSGFLQIDFADFAD